MKLISCKFGKNTLSESPKFPGRGTPPSWKHAVTCCLTECHVLWLWYPWREHWYPTHTSL